MDGSAELAKLAELLRLGAQTGRQVALLRSRGDAIVIEQLAQQAEAMAAKLDALVTPVDGASRDDDHKH